MSVVTQIQVRRGTASQWTSTDPTLASGEWGFETDTGKVNSAPQTLLAPMVIVRQGFTYGITIPYTDSDVTDTVRCRWSLSSKGECSGTLF